MGRTRTLLVAMLALLAAPASALAEPCLGITTGARHRRDVVVGHDQRFGRSARPAADLPVRRRADDQLRHVDPHAQLDDLDARERHREARRPDAGHDLPLPPRRVDRLRSVRVRARRDLHDAAATGPAADGGGAAGVHLVADRERRGDDRPVRRERRPRAGAEPLERLRSRPSRPTARAWSSRARAAATATCTSSTRTARASSRSRTRATPTRRRPGRPTASRSCSRRAARPARASSS